MLGTLENAETILAYVRSGGLYSSEAPEGFTYLSSGCFRNAFRGPDGHVYKVDSHPDRERSMGYGNLSEWNTFCEWIQNGRTSEFAELPDTWLHENGVICAEYVANDGKRPEINIHEAFKSLCVGAYMWPSDMYGDNFRVRNGKYVAVDFGHWQSSPGIDWYAIDAKDQQAHPENWIFPVLCWDCAGECEDETHDRFAGYPRRKDGADRY